MENSKVFFGFAIADSMFAASAEISKRPLTPGQVKEFVRDGVLTPCLNPSHKATIDAMVSRYGINVEIPATAPQVSLVSGDSVIVMGVRGLPRLDATRHEYTSEEIASATFTFSIYEVK